MGPKTAPKKRDRDATAAAIVGAAKALIAEKGFGALGVNAVAREAGCDKQLIYRYFDGVDGLVEAVGEDTAAWVTRALSDCTLPDGAPYAVAIHTFLDAFLRALKDDALMLQLIAWELSDPGPAVGRMADARSAALANSVIPLLRRAAAPPAGIDAPAVNALLIGAVQHLAASARTQGGFAGMPLKTEADWERLRQSLHRVVDAVYGG